MANRVPHYITLVSIPEASRLLGIAPRTLQNRLSTGALGWVDIEPLGLSNLRRAIYLDDVLELIEQEEREA